ncbi:MAG: hypothetical protein KDI36_17140, partial [Pseudomonadales bacterium]|nr:hypothetical protein [Pseudomonadales bacterium]
MPFSIAGPASPALPSLDGINRIAQRISSGTSVEFRDNAAEAAIAGRLDTVQGERTVSVRNITDQISAAQKADDTLGYVSSLVERIQSYEVQLGNGALNQNDRSVIEDQIASDRRSARDAIQNASFNGNPLFETQQGKALVDALDDLASDLVPV